MRAIIFLGAVERSSGETVFRVQSVADGNFDWHRIFYELHHRGRSSMFFLCWHQLDYPWRALWICIYSGVGLLDLCSLLLGSEFWDVLGGRRCVKDGEIKGTVFGEGEQGGSKYLYLGVEIVVGVEKKLRIKVWVNLIREAVLTQFIIKIKESAKAFLKVTIKTTRTKIKKSSWITPNIINQQSQRTSYCRRGFLRSIERACNQKEVGNSRFLVVHQQVGKKEEKGRGETINHQPSHGWEGELEEREGEEEKGRRGNKTKTYV